MSELVFHNDTDHHRYEAVLDGVPAGFVEYSILSQAIMLTHTEVLPNFEGKGVGGFLARESLAAVREDAKRLQRLTTKKGLDLTAKIPWGNGQTYLRTILVAIDHTSYHVGQIIVVRRLLGMWPPA